MNAMLDTLSSDAPVEGTPVDIASALGSLKPSDRTQKLVTFREHYAGIEAALARGATQADVRAALKKGKLSLSAATFRKMLEAERERCKSIGGDRNNLEGGAE